MSDNLNRVFIWGVPRSISTALTKCLSFIDGVQVVHEPHACAYHVGPERMLDPQDKECLMSQAVQKTAQSDEFEDGGINDKTCTYKWVRDKLEAPYGDKKFLISKDMAYTVEGKYDMLPKGFKYSFVIRHPNKVFVSWKKTLQNTFKVNSKINIDLENTPVNIFPKGRGYKEMCNLVDYVDNSLGQEPVILDTDDLLSDPSGFLSAYCSKMGLPYSPELLTWDEGSAITDGWIMSSLFKTGNKRGGYYQTAFQSSGFKAQQPIPPVEGLDDDIKACIKASMPYYEKLHARRIKPLPATN